MIEIDLLRDGDRLPLGRPRPPVADYYIIVSPADRRPKTSVWAFTIQEPIPTFAVPIRHDLEVVPLDLKACLDRIYDDGRYEARLHYDQPPVPQLDAPRTLWANELLCRYLLKK